MASRSRTSFDDEPTPSRAATTPEAREAEISSAAYDLAEKQIQNGTASAQVISHFLKAGSVREQLEQQRLRTEQALAEARIQELKDRPKFEALMVDAINAMRTYQGAPPAELEAGDEDQDV